MVELNPTQLHNTFSIITIFLSGFFLILLGILMETENLYSALVLRVAPMILGSLLLLIIL